MDVVPLYEILENRILEEIENVQIKVQKLDHKLESPRIEIVTEPYPNRWTHHLLISDTEEIDDELMAWVREAANFSNTK